MKNPIEIMHRDAAVIVPLSNSEKTATLDATDFDALMAKEISPRWRLGDNQKVYSSGNKIVARLIAGAGKKQIVKYADGDTTNLRRSNLILTSYSKNVLNIQHTFENQDQKGGQSMSV